MNEGKVSLILTFCVLAGCAHLKNETEKDASLKSEAVRGYISTQPIGSAFIIDRDVVDRVVLANIAAEGYRIIAPDDVSLEDGKFIEKNTGKEAERLSFEAGSIKVLGKSASATITITAGIVTLWYECTLVKQRHSEWKFVRGEVVGAT